MKVYFEVIGVFFAFFCLVCQLFISDLVILNLILVIYRYVFSAYITAHLALPDIEKINFNC